MPSDLLSLRDLEIWTRIGVEEQERVLPQKILVSVKLNVDVSPTVHVDSVDATIDYGAVCKTIQGLAATERHTIERLAEDIAALLLEKYVEHVMVTVKKFPADLPALKEASVRITRKKYR